MILYIFQCHSPKSSHPLPLPQSPKDYKSESDASLSMCSIIRLSWKSSPPASQPPSFRSFSVLYIFNSDVQGYPELPLPSEACVSLCWRTPCYPHLDLGLNKTTVGSVFVAWLHYRALSTAERSHPTSEVRGRSREDRMPKGQRPRGVTPRPRSRAAAKSARLQGHRNGREELPKTEVKGGS